MSRGYNNLVDDTIEYANFINDDTFFYRIHCRLRFPMDGKKRFKSTTCRRLVYRFPLKTRTTVTSGRGQPSLLTALTVSISHLDLGMLQVPKKLENIS